MYIELSRTFFIIENRQIRNLLLNIRGLADEFSQSFLLVFGNWQGVRVAREPVQHPGFGGRVHVHDQLCRKLFSGFLETVLV